ncbi:hypothetical protein [Vibrio parahaemolyticus]|uniref:hypothetical protein n=1 Tax=Vibrio parahaemolyticus TaxID=670 RepID=UPI00040D69BE|nr:hypothetical protein [Vibrio parahaemolyticus]EHH2454100.1 hypothetical protein [Vibrio parahaemolyticus]EJE4185992.1 hypothetical protein [Vibrio parahaemolyticus]EJE4553957.1 hypothetical protein [Vibrio parahaemolyticus]ELI5444847.1 hypothetical protein [Vibrio parahaemolyticus]TBT88841.1 hypothetical protein D4752_19145 [Vibrio parahaemolyticus]
MAFLLRKISPNKWQPNLELNPENYTADAITGCNRTQQNTLSVWHSDTNDFTDESVEQIIVALAITMPQPAKIDVIWLEEEKLAEHGLLIISTKAETEFEKINDLHKDIAELDHQKLAIVSEHIVKQFLDSANRKSITKPALIKLVSEWAAKEDTFDLNLLSDKWIDGVNRYRQRAAASS